MARGKVAIVIPDSHSVPGFNNERYTWIGRLIEALRPEYVIDIGDWYSMESLSSYDKGKKSYEGRRYAKDIEAGNDGQERLLFPLRQAKRKFPKFFRCLGNHENRITRALEFDPILIGTIGLSDLQSKESYWEEYPFLVPLELEGVQFQHYFTTGVKNLPVGGAHQAFTLLMKEHRSSVQGHTHIFDYCVQRAGPKFIHGLVVGCCQDYDADWAGPANAKWNRGIVVLRGLDSGEFDHEWISIDRLKEAYGNV